MEFVINEAKWIIKEKKMIEDEKYFAGLTEYKTQTIYIDEELPEDGKIRTLKHELCHCWLWEYGHNQHSNKKYTNEDICEIVSASHSFIDSVSNMYIAYKSKNK